MLDDLRRLLGALPAEARRADYAAAIREDNVLGKRTHATRVHSDQRLSELYGLDPSLALFRALRALWDQDPEAQPLLALLCALARDPLLRATADPLLSQPTGTEWSRPTVGEAVRRATLGRLKEEVIEKVIRNAASSWTQSGHLSGRVRKVRRPVTATVHAAVYAAVVAYLMGLRGRRLIDSAWIRALDSSPNEILLLLAEGKKLGLVDLKHSGDVLEISFPALLSAEEMEAARGAD